MIDEKLARLRMHRNNISRYRRLLKTDLSELERQVMERRINEENPRWKVSLHRAFP